MPTVLFRSLIYLVFLSSAFVATNAQNRQEPSGRILEIHSGRWPRPSVIALSSEHSNGFWGAGFPRLKDWKLPSTGDPVQAMDFKARLVGDKAEVMISLFTGKRFGENVEVIARIAISEGETIEVSDLKKFGFEPVAIKMLVTPTAVADVPLVTNPAPLLRTTVNSIVATIPTLSVKFENGSPKAIMAFEWHTETDGRRLMSGVAQGKYGNALIVPGGLYEMNLKTNTRDTDHNPVTMVIGAVIYEDGSIDGSPQAAVAFLAYTEGRKRALEQLVPLLLKTAETKSGRPDMLELIAKVDLLTDGGPKVNGRPASPVGIAFAGIITEALGRLRQLNSESVGKSDAEAISSMTELANFYRAWQVKMKK